MSTTKPVSPRCLGASGSVRQTTIGTRGGARVSVVTTSEIDLTAGHSTSYAVAPAESLTITSYPLAGVAPGNPFVSMMRTVGDQ